MNFIAEKFLMYAWSIVKEKKKKKYDVKEYYWKKKKKCHVACTIL